MSRMRGGIAGLALATAFGVLNAFHTLDPALKEQAKFKEEQTKELQDQYKDHSAKPASTNEPATPGETVTPEPINTDTKDPTSTSLMSKILKLSPWQTAPKAQIAEKEESPKEHPLEGIGKESLKESQKSK